MARGNWLNTHGSWSISLAFLVIAWGVSNLKAKRQEAFYAQPAAIGYFIRFLGRRISFNAYLHIVGDLLFT